jgi:hypothetical protein
VFPCKHRETDFLEESMKRKKADVVSTGCRSFRGAAHFTKFDWNGFCLGGRLAGAGEYRSAGNGIGGQQSGDWRQGRSRDDPF